MSLLSASLAWLVAAAVPSSLVAGVNADAGVEYDSNANRVSPGTDTSVRGGPLLRGTMGTQLGYAGGRQRLRAQLQIGGKVFLLPTLQDQNVGVILGSYEHGVQLVSDGRLRLSGVADYYDAFQAPASLIESRDFRSLSVSVRLAGVREMPSAPQHRIDGGLDLGMQYFAFKPDAAFTFVAPSAAARLSALLHAGDPELGHDFDLSLHLRADYRGYMFGRTDLFIQTGGSLTWQGPALLQAGYMVQLALSNTNGESYQRHLVLAKLGVRLPGDLYVTGKAQLNLLQGAPGLYVPVSNIDDDNRSLGLIDIERPLPRGFGLVLRYTGYFSLPGERSSLDAMGSYQRHTVYLGASYAYRTRKK
ncbi:MAG: hypothetical protein JNJ46_24145 [Myxococcales bacterium]|nr:hypothetical protein [Myxococcales bacterium]